MKFLLSILTSILIFITIGVQAKDTKRTTDDLLLLPLGISRDYNIRRAFTGGDSLDQRQAKELAQEQEIIRQRAEQLRRSNGSNARGEEDTSERSKGTMPAEKLYYSEEIGYNCVSFAQTKGFNQTGFQYAKYISTTENEPRVGGFLVTYEGYYGHVVWIRQIKAETLVIEESNYISGWVTSREIPRDYNQIKGYL